MEIVKMFLYLPKAEIFKKLFYRFIQKKSCVWLLTGCVWSLFICEAVFTYFLKFLKENCMLVAQSIWEATSF